MALAPDQLLHLGPDPAGVGWNHFDLGLGLSSHINYPQAQLKNSPPQGQPWFYSKTNPTSGKDVVVFSAPLGGATTSTNTQYARCELREYERNGTTKAAWNPNDGDHWVEGIYRIYGLSGLDKPGVCVQQAHDPNDDVLMIRTELVSGQIHLKLRYNGTLVATLNSNYTDGTEFYLKSRLINGTPEVYYTTNLASIPSSPTHTSSGYFSGAASGWYFKTGSYNQTNESTDPDVDQDASIIRVEVRELKHWHSKTPLGGAWPTPATYTVVAGTPIVNAGADASFALGGAFSRTASITLNGATLNSWSWKILEAPSGASAGGTISTSASVNFSPTVAGKYTLEAIAVTSAGTYSDTVVLNVASVTTPTDTTTAAGVKNWGKPIAVEEFNYTGPPNSSRWGVYNGPGHAGNGTRDPNRVTVDGSKMVGTGLNNGASFGMSHRHYQQYGKWEVRMRCFPTGGTGSGSLPSGYGVYPDGTAIPNITGGGSGTPVNISSLSSAASNGVYNYTGADITSATSVDFSGKTNITIKGISMAQGGRLTPKAGTNIILEIDAPYELQDGGETVKWVGQYDRVVVQNSRFGPSTADTSPTTVKNRFVQFGDSTSVGARFGTVRRCTFQNKNGPGNMVHTVGDTGQAQGGVRYSLAQFCHFIGSKPFDENDHEAALWGISSLQLTNGQQLIEFCRFEGNRSEPEVVSMKMNWSTIRGCTFHNNVGSVSLRHGDDGAIYDCFIYGFEEETGGGSYNRTSAGPRMYGARHKVFNNTIQVNGNGGSRPSASSLYETPLTLDSGDVAPGSTSNGHANITGIMVENNLLYNCGNPITVVDNYGTAPTGTVRNNWIVQCANAGSDGVRAFAGGSKAGLSISGNTVYASAAAAGLTAGPGGHFVAPSAANRGARTPYLTASMVGQGSVFNPYTTSTPTTGVDHYHVVLIVWPESGRWPEDGEYDFVELSIPGQQTLAAFMHFPHDANVSVQQRYFERANVDTSQWHNYALEWTPNELIGYVDGIEWFRTSGGASSIRRNIQDMPSGGLTIQLDNFDGTNQIPATMEVDWVRVYPHVPIPLDPTTPTDPGGGGTPGGGTSTGTYPTFVSTGTAVSQGDGTATVNVPAPPNVRNEDFQICVIQGCTSAEVMNTVPAGWNLLDEQAITTFAGGDSGDTSMVWVYYNTTGDNVSRSWVKSGTRGFHGVRMAWRNVSAVSDHEVRISSATTTTPYATPVIPTTDRAIAVAIMASDRQNVTAGPVSVPTGWNQRYNAGPVVNDNEYEWISVADIQVPDKAVAGANVPSASGLATSNFKLTNADACQLFSFVLEGPITTGTTYNASVLLGAGTKLDVNQLLAPIPAGSILLRSLAELMVRSIVRGGANFYALPKLLINSSLFPRGAFIIVPTLTFQERVLGFPSIGLQSTVILRAGALPYRRPVLRNEYAYPPQDHPFRLIAQRILDGEIVEWELPVSEDFEYTDQLSGPTIMQGSFSPELISVQELGLDGYAYWLHVEINQEIRASAILLPPQYEESGMAFTAEGVAAVPHYTTYDSIYSQIQVDPLSIVRTLWNYVQAQPQSDYGVVLSQNSSPVRIGIPARTETTTRTLEDGTVETTTREIPAEPYELNWWDAKNVGEEIDSLSGATPFDFVERHMWNADRSDVLHFVDLGYPRLGVARPELLFNEENIRELVPIQEPEDTYASAVLVIGAGDGADTIRAYRAEPFADRVRKQKVITDKAITNQKMADARAIQELNIARGRAFEVGELVVAAYHPNAPVGSYRVGDDIQVQVEVPWLNILHTAWYRITSIQNRPSGDTIRLGVARSDTLLDTSDIWIQPDDYIPFDPVPPVGPVGYQGNVFLAIVTQLNAVAPVPIPTARVYMLTETVITVNGAVFGGSFAFANNLFALPNLVVANPQGLLVASALLAQETSLYAHAVRSAPGEATVSMTSPVTLVFGQTSIGISISLPATPALTASANTATNAGTVNMAATATLGATGRLTAGGAVSMVVGKTLSANGTVGTSGPTTTQLGKTDNGSGTSSSSSNRTTVSKFTAGNAGTVTAGHSRLWVDTGSASIRMVIYADSAGEPGALLGVSDAKSLTSTTVDNLEDFTFAGANQVSITVGTDYWIGFAWSDPGTNNISWSRGTTVGIARQGVGDAPNPFGTPTALAGPIDAYVDVVSGSGSGEITNRTATKNELTSATSITGAIPSGTQPGEYVVAVFSSNDITGLSDPSGWTRIITPFDGGAGVGVAAYYRKYQAGDAGPTLSWTNAGRCGAICQTYGGVHATTPIDATAVIKNQAGAVAASVAIGPYTVATAGARLISAIVMDGNSTTGQTVTVPSEMTRIAHTNNTSGQIGRYLSVADEERSTTGSVTRTWTQSPAELTMSGFIVALRPA